jgi:transposase
LLTKLGHEVLVANPPCLHRRHEDKNDEIDVESLARWGRSDPCLLRPIQHRAEDRQADLPLVRSRDQLMGTRTRLINHVRGAVKSMGARIPKCSAEAFHTCAALHILSSLKPALRPVLQTISGLKRTLRQCGSDGSRRRPTPLISSGLVAA